MSTSGRNRGFSKFLKTTRKVEFSSNESQGEAPSGPANGSAPVKLLAALARGPSSVPALLEQTQSDFVQLAGQLKMLQDTGLVLTEGTGSAQRVKLTDMGRRVLSGAAELG